MVQFAEMTTGNKLLTTCCFIYIYRVLCNIEWKHTSRQREHGEDGHRLLSTSLYLHPSPLLFILFSLKQIISISCEASKAMPSLLFACLCLVNSIKWVDTQGKTVAFISPTQKQCLHGGSCLVSDNNSKWLRHSLKNTFRTQRILDYCVYMFRTGLLSFILKVNVVLTGQVSLATSCNAALVSLKCSSSAPISNRHRPFISLSST